jgi:hypothetical protein
MRVTVAALLVVPLLTAGCATTPAVEAGVKVRPETRPECAAHCETLGMRLGAIVLIRNAAGCVCELREAPPAPGAGAPADAPRASTIPGGSAAAAAAAVSIAAEEVHPQHEDHDTRSASR